MIRKAVFEDLQSINEIYNQAVVHKHQTADTELITEEARETWFLMHSADKYPVFVYLKENKLVGWFSLSAYRPGRKILETTAEVSYYLHKDFQGQGIGTLLLKTAISESKKYKFRNLIAILLESNIASIKLLEKFNFEKWGALKKIARFDDKDYDHLYYGLKL